MAKMTRDQAIQTGYADQVAAVDAVNCDFTGRVLRDAPDLVEFSASYKFMGADDGCEYTIVAYYYQDKEDVATRELDSLDWVATNYEIM